MIILLNLSKKNPPDHILKELAKHCMAEECSVVAIPDLNAEQKLIFKKVVSELVMLSNWSVAQWFQADDPWLPPVHMEDR